MKRYHRAKRFAAHALGLGVAVGLACLPSITIAQSVNPTMPGRNVSIAAVERSVSPAANTAVANARVLVPDGTSLVQAHASGETRWFAFNVEQGKTYAVEAIDTAGDFDFNALTLGVFASDGTSAPPEAQVNCGNRDSAPPSLEVQGAGLDGARCVIRVNYPDFLQTLNKRAMYASVSSNRTTPFQIRVRESTLYGRWTTNGYDFHVELQNTSTDPVCVELDFYPGTGVVGPTGNIFATVLTVPPKGAAKYVRPNASTAGGDNKGTLRVHDCGNGHFVPGTIQLNTYAYNPVTTNFIPYSSSSSVNNGSTANSWQ